MLFTEYLIEAAKKSKKWMQDVKEDSSLRKLLGVGEDESIKDISDSKIKSAIKSHGADVERKLIAYANMVGGAEKKRILSIVKKTPNKDNK